MRELFNRFRALFRRRRLEDDLDDELRSHLEMAIEINLRKGMSPADARREALRSFGGLEQTKEIYRDQRGLPMIETTLQDLRFGLRMLRRSPGFSILAILCLTLGIGANAAVFSWIEGILFRPYPAVAHQERLVAIGGTSRDEPRDTPLSWPDFQDLQRSCTLCETVFVSKITGTTLSIGDRAERTTGSIVSANYFDAIGVHPILGRGFLPGEDIGQSAHPVAVISYQLWQGRFRGDPQIAGKTQRLNGVMHTIVGVVPEGFYGTFVGWSMNFWVPASMEDIFESGGNVGNFVLVRSFARRHEMSVRLAVGAGRARLWKQLLTEGLVLSLFGAAGGLLVAYWCRPALVLLFPARGGVQMHLPGEIDWRVLALSVAVCLATTLLMGLVPALQTGKIDLAQSMKMESTGVVGGRGRAWVRSGLVLVQVSLSFVLLVGTGLLMQSLLKVRNA